MKHCCGICDEEKEQGMYLYHLFICASCEREIVNTEPEEPVYQEFVRKLQAITKPKQFS